MRAHEKAMRCEALRYGAVRCGAVRCHTPDTHRESVVGFDKFFGSKVEPLVLSRIEHEVPVFSFLHPLLLYACHNRTDGHACARVSTGDWHSSRPSVAGPSRCSCWSGNVWLFRVRTCEDRSPLFDLPSLDQQKRINPSMHESLKNEYLR